MKKKFLPSIFSLSLFLAHALIAEEEAVAPSPAPDLTPKAAQVVPSVPPSPLDSTLPTPAVPYTFLYDKNFSPYAGAENILMLQHLVQRGEDLVLGRPPSYSSFGRGLGRFIEQLGWDVFNVYLMATQHEVFGHGYRVRSLGTEYAQVNKYKFTARGASTSIAITDKLTTTQMASIDIAGMEATAILANQMRLKWLQKGQLDGREASLYLASEHDLTRYVQSLNIKDSPFIYAGHDVKNYLYNLNATYPGGNLSKTKLRNRSLINYLDPFTIYSWASWWKFVIDGKAMKLPMIPLGSYGYLPSFRMGLTPFGPEYFFENFFVKDKRPLYFYCKWGKFADNTYYGFGLENAYLLDWKGLTIGYRFDAWKQPQLLTQPGTLQAYQLLDMPPLDTLPELYTPQERGQESVGASLSAIVRMQIINPSLFLYLQPGYKMKGFVPGESLSASPILRMGLSIEF